MVEKLKMWLFGQCFNYPKEGYATAHVVEYRDVEFARAFVALGWDVQVVSSGYEGMAEGGYWLSSNVSDHDSIDSVFLVDITGFKNARKMIDMEMMRAHDFQIGCYIDDAYSEEGMQYVTDWSVPSPTLAHHYRTTFRDANTFLGPWGVPLVGPQPNPYDVGNKLPRVIHGGILFPRAIEWLNELAERGNVEVWHCGLWTAPDRCRGFTDDERESMLHPRIHCATDIEGLYEGLHGPIVFGQHFKYLEHARVGIALNIMTGRDTVICKMYDYFGCGIPVVCDDGFPNAGDPAMLRAGESVPFMDKEAFFEAVERQAGTYYDRDTIKGKARTMGTWFDIAARFDWAFRRALDD